MDVHDALDKADMIASGGKPYRDTAFRVIATLAAEVRRLGGAMLGDIRKTADGVAVTFKGHVYHPDCVRKELAVEVNDPDNIDVPTKIGRDNFVCESISVTVEECYSTRASAEAARERGGT